jgi:2-C-methyl-D-erythritol 4-phosphate cytidylyltransferase
MTKFPGFKAALIIPAAGSGQRLGGVSKPFIKLKDKPILLHTLDRFKGLEFIKEIILVLREEDIRWAIQRYEKTFKSLGVKKFITGGKRRMDSVYRGVMHVEEDSQLIIIHDAVRPFVSIKIINEVIRIAWKWGAAISAIPVVDTLKEARGWKIRKTLDRANLWQAQTPQAFRKEILLKSYSALDDKNYTDEASLVERAGFHVRMVLGSPKNLKITSGDDLEMAKIFIKYIQYV